MKFKSLLIIGFISLCLSSCNDKADENEAIVEAVDPLINIGLIHEWLLDCRVVNDVS